MKKRNISNLVIVGFSLFQGIVFGQQWSGPNDQTSTISRTGNVGIGTTTPQAQLHVVNGNQGLKLLTGTSTSGYDLSIGVNNDGVNFSNNSIGRGFNFSNANGNLATLSSNGNVGIGTTNPSGQIHLASNNDHEFKMTRASGAYGFRIFRNAQVGRFFIQNTDDNNVWGTRIQIEEGGAAWQNIFLNPNGGNVGIGTTNPQARLDVRGGVSFSEGRLYQAGDIPNDNNAQFYNNSLTGYGLYSQGGGGGRYVFHFLNQSGTSILYGRSDGNVGIGTYSPDAKLAVKGTVHANEVKVDLAVPGPDYVFNSDYNLLSLEEIKTYIDKNKHLPEVPSAKEMEANGVQLGEMNMLLLKKIEELTLYTIDMNKRLQELTVESDEQRKEIIQLKANQPNPSKK